jgi:hypothetical protein
MSIRLTPSVLKAFPVAAALAVFGAGFAWAQEPTPMQKFMDAIGVIEIPKDPINYRERAPLVVPPTQALIPPRGTDEIRAANPDWPVDHDARRRAAGKKAEQEMYTDERFYSGVRLTPDEMRRGTSRGAQRVPSQPGAENHDTNRLLPSQLGFKGWNMKKDEQVVFTGEPERRSLTEPPTGLRTPSRDAPYGVVSERPTPAKRDPFQRGPGDYK